MDIIDFVESVYISLLFNPRKIILSLSYSNNYTYLYELLHKNTIYYFCCYFDYLLW